MIHSLLANTSTGKKHIVIYYVGEKYAILIDTGLGVSNIRKIVDSLTELPVMAVTTHVHWDHIGGHKYFDNIAVHEAEKDWLIGQVSDTIASCEE